MKKVLIITAILLSTAIANAQSTLGVTLNVKDTLGNWPTFDGTLIVFDNSADTVDLNDFIKLENPSENIAIYRNDSFLAIEKRTTHASTQLILWNLHTDRDYELVLTKTNFASAAGVEDLVTGTLTMFADTPVHYRFTSDTNLLICRFRIIFPTILAINPTQPITPQRVKATFGVYPNPSANYTYIKGLPAGRHDVVFNGPDKRAYTIISDGRTPIRFNHNLRSGVYYVTIDANVTKTIIIQ